MKLIAPCLAFLLGACAAAAGPAPGMAPAADSNAELQRLAAATTPTHPMTIRFGWAIDEADLRARGEGLLRVEAPERLRLDLFGPRGDTYLVAALIEEEYRLPAAAARIELPHPSLLWAALGVVRPPEGADVSVFLDEDAPRWSVELVLDGETIRIDGRTDDRPVVESAALERGGRVILFLDHRASADGTPQRSVYTDRPEARRITFDFVAVEPADSFPSTIWQVR